MKIIIQADGVYLLMSSRTPDTYRQCCTTAGLEFKVTGTTVSWDFPKQLVPSEQDLNCEIERGFLVAIADFLF